MFVAYEPEDYIHSLIEVRKSDARRRFRKSIFDDYPLRGPLGQPACAYCGRWDEKKLTIDHIVPKSKGGAHFQKNNMAPSCLACNSSKSNIQVWQWWRDQEFWCPDRANLLSAWIAFYSEETRKNCIIELSNWESSILFLRAA